MSVLALGMTRVVVASVNESTVCLPMAYRKSSRSPKKLPLSIEESA